MRYLHETLKLIKSGELSPEEHLEDIISGLDKDKEINSFITLDLDGARERVKNINPSGELYGAVVGLKDNINYKGLKTTCASKMLENFESVYNADCAENIESEGGVVIGKLNMDEFAMGSSNETSYFGPVKNPIDHTLVPGGSSGGSAAATKMGFVDVAVGTDTGGSIRQPGSFCSVVGFKPTYGLVSRYGVTSLANTFDSVGSFGRCVEDAYILLRAMAKDTSNDMTKISVDMPEMKTSIEEDIENLKGKKIAILSHLKDFDLAPEVKESYDKTLKLLEGAGAEIVEAEFEHLDYAVATYYAIIDSEASSNLSRFDGIRYAGIKSDVKNFSDYMKEVRTAGFSDEVKRRILLGMYIMSSDLRETYYDKALIIREKIAEDYDRIPKNADAILTPTATTLPFKLGSQVKNPRQMMEGDLLTVAINLAGIPGINVPSTSENVINAGMQFLGKKKSDYNLARIARAYEGLVK